MGYTQAKIDIDKAIELRLVNKLTYKEIATYFNVSPQAVHKVLKNRISSHEVDIPTITKKRYLVLSHQHFRTVSAITQSKLDKSSARDLAVISKLLYQQKELESQKSSNAAGTTFVGLVENSMSKHEI